MIRVMDVINDVAPLRLASIYRDVRSGVGEGRTGDMVHMYIHHVAVQGRDVERPDVVNALCHCGLKPHWLLVGRQSRL